MSSGGTFDIETGTSRNLYPTMTESRELRWGFVLKVYAIVTAELLLTVAVSAMVVKFYATSLQDYEWWIGLIWLFIPFVSKLFVLLFSLNHLLLAIFNISFALAIGMACSFIHGKVILEAVVLTAVVVVSLTLFTFWAAKRGNDFNLLGPVLFGAIAGLLVCALFLIFLQLDTIAVMIYECLAVIIFCCCIVYDTDNLIKGYIWAAVELYHDIIILFMALLTVIIAADHSM